jgi:PncC family amidohydrolase
MLTDVELVAEVCTQRGLTVAVAESLTAGLLASAIGEGPDAKEWFCGAVVAYQTAVKARVLGLADGVDPCSAACATQLAVGARDLLRADLVVSTTGVGGPDPEDGHPPGSVFIGWATAHDASSRFIVLEGGPAEILEQTVHAAVAVLLETARGTSCRRITGRGVPSSS